MVELSDKDREFVIKMKDGLQDFLLKEGSHPELQEGQNIIKRLIKMTDKTLAREV